MSSSACAEPPSGPTSRPGWLATILALRLAIADRKPRLFEGARQEDGKARDDRKHAGRGQAAGRRHHVLFGDAELDQPLGIGLAEMMHAGAAGDVGVENDELGKFVGQAVRALPKASRSESPDEPMRAGAALLSDIEKLLDFFRFRAESGQARLRLAARVSLTLPCQAGPFSM